jgi:hypothetical protein
MAHADYECCAVCDSKMAFSYDAGAKEVLCSHCVAELAMRGVFVHNVDELLRWMETEKPDVVLATLEKVGFRCCFYSNEVDGLFRELKGG